VSMELMKKAVASSTKAELPKFDIGDTVDVAVKIIEGDKERVQVFTGTVIGRRGAGIHETFTVRRIVAGEGVERIFPVHSPRITYVKVIRKAKTRRAKLYYLRERTGKATQLREQRMTGKAKAKAPIVPASEPEPAASVQ
jgi:large subunit ribosomal protein L19